MSKTYDIRVDELKNRLQSLSRRIDMFEGLNIEMTAVDMPNDLLHTAGRILSHAESEIEDIYHILYRIKLEQNRKEE